MGGLSGTAAVTPVGGGQPHTNMPPYLGVSFIICTIGIFP
jgi:microcystin-dependent protein